MFVEFQQVKFSNFLSYGNAPIVFELQKGMNLITGQNGTGKSCILDAISFALFGQPYRKIKIAELINRRNKRHLSTEITFKIGGVQYRIERGLNPNKLEVYKDDEAMELLSSKKLTQTEIDKILGINHELFRQIISLAISYNRPFLSMPAGEKRDIIENIFGIKIFGEMLKILKKNTAGVKTQTEISKKTIELLETSMKGLKKQLRDSKSANKDFEKNKKADIQNIHDKIERFQKEINSFAQTKKDNLKNIKEVDYKAQLDLGEKISLLETSIENNSFELKNLIQNEKLLKDNATCPSCRQKIEEGHRIEELQTIENKKKELAEFIRQEDIDQFKFKEQNDVFNKQLERNKEFENQNSMIDDKLKFYQTEIDSLKLDIETINTRSINFNFESVEKTLSEKSNEYVSIYKQYQEFVKASRTNDTVSMILSEEGVKSYFFKKLIPLLNSKVNEVLNKFDLPLQIRFNELMEESIYNYTNGNYIVNYYSLSEGEKKRIDIAILLAFINVTKIINNWRCNLVLMDELLDSSVDGEGLDRMIECLSNYASDTQDQCCIYLISHRTIDNNFFNTTYIVRKNNGFSFIELKSS